MKTKLDIAIERIEDMVLDDISIRSVESLHNEIKWEIVQALKEMTIQELFITIYRDI